MARTVAEKMGIKQGMRAHLVDAPASLRSDIGAPKLDVSEQLRGDFAYLHLFTSSRDEMAEVFPRLKAHLAENGMLWVSWPKGRRLGTDLTLPGVIEIGYRHGLVESTTLSIDATWSAIKFTHPKPGKTYANSYGTLPGATD